MIEPKDAVGKIVKSLEKFFNPRSGKIEVKSRPSLIIGFELDYNSLTDVDYELMPIATLKNRKPDDTYDYPINGQFRMSLGLAEDCYIRTHKISWNNIKHMKLHKPIGDLKHSDPKIFNVLLTLNEQWVTARNRNSQYKIDESKIKSS